MASTAQARRAAASARPYDEEVLPARPRARRTAQAQPRAAHAFLSRTLLLFIVCLTALAVGRVALSFAVVQKTLQTDVIARQERQVSAENARLAENLARLSSAVHIRYVAQRELGLVDPDHVKYLRARALGAGAGGHAER